MILTAILIAVVYLYAPVRGFDYVWDDKVLILDDINVQRGILTWETISRPVLKETTYFRPLVFATYVLETKYFGVNPLVSHVVNILIFIVNIFLAYFLSFFIFQKLKIKNLAWLVAMLYAFHPTLVESNAWIAGRFDLLCATFLFSALLVFFSRKKTGIFSDLLICSLFILGLLCKEMAIIFPGLLIIYYVAVNHGNSLLNNIKDFLKNNSRLLIFLFLTILFYFALRIFSMGDVYHFKSAAEANKGNQNSIFLPFYTLLFYVHQVILPFFDINPQHNLKIELNKSYQNVLVYLVFLGALTLLFFSAVKNKMLGWLGGAAIFSLSPVLNIIPMTIGGNIGHERFLTVPLLFFIIFFISAIQVIYKKLPDRITKKIIVYIIGLFFIIFSFFTTLSIVPIWNSNYSLWGWMYKNTPTIDYVVANYFLALLKENRIDEFEKEFEKLSEKNNNLKPMEMVLYASYLLDKKDERSSSYIKKTIDGIKSQNFEEGNNILGSIKASSSMVYYLYIDHATALATIDGDLESALESSLEADKWFKYEQNYAALWQRLAYLKLLNKNQEAKILFLSVKNIQTAEGANLPHKFLDIVYANCMKFDMKDSKKCEKKSLDLLNNLG